jgi:zinc D-Ala-D-Ala carboxypeptidase
MPWKHFLLSEFACRGGDCCGGQNLIDEDLVAMLDALRDECGFALPVTSGYRCSKHNQRVSSTGPDGPHTTGKACDIGVDRGRAVQVLQIALRMGFTGIGINQKGNGRFIHLDIVERQGRSVWSY